MVRFAQLVDPRSRPYSCLLVALLAGGTPAAQEYTIGPGDVLRITVWGHDDLSRDYSVTAGGRVPFPLIGSVPAAGPHAPASWPSGSGISSRRTTWSIPR